MPPKTFLIIVNSTTLIALAVSFAFGWIHGQQGEIIAFVSLILMNGAAAIGLRRRSR